MPELGGWRGWRLAERCLPRRGPGLTSTRSKGVMATYSLQYSVAQESGVGRYSVSYRGWRQSSSIFTTPSSPLPAAYVRAVLPTILVF